MCTVIEPRTSVQLPGVQVFLCESSVMSARKSCRDQVVKLKCVMVRNYDASVQAVGKKGVSQSDTHFKKFNLASK